MLDTSLFGGRLSELRKKRGLSKAALGRIIGVSTTQISEMERGTSATTMQRLILLCEYFSVSSDYLLGLTDDMQPRKPVQLSSATPETEPAPWMTLEEFQAFADAQAGSWELINGVPVKMDSASDSHQWLSINLSAQFLAYFKGKPCIPLPGKDVWTSTEELNDARDHRKDSTRKPDLLVYCDKAQRVHNVIVKPDLVAEIWSHSNSYHERSLKTLLYQTIGVKEIWTIDSETADFIIAFFENGRNIHMRQGHLDNAPLTSFLFPGLTVDLSGVMDILENQPDSNA